MKANEVATKVLEDAVFEKRAELALTKEKRSALSRRIFDGLSNGIQPEDDVYVPYDRAVDILHRDIYELERAILANKS